MRASTWQAQAAVAAGAVSGCCRRRGALGKAPAPGTQRQRLTRCARLTPARHTVHAASSGGGSPRSYLPGGGARWAGRVGGWMLAAPSARVKSRRQGT